MNSRIDHICKSRILRPKLKASEFFRGWLEKLEHQPFIGALEEAALLEQMRAQVQAEERAAFEAVDKARDEEDERAHEVAQAKEPMQPQNITEAEFTAWLKTHGYNGKETRTALGTDAKSWMKANGKSWSDVAQAVAATLGK